jgi:eukaryotic-like serine/threonine-protein kinase
MGTMDDEALFAAALEKTPPERQAFLAQACVGAPDVLARIEALLHAHEHPDTFLDPPEGRIPALREPVTEAPGSVIGSYRLLEQIGEGGFGVVFRAEQQQPVRREVALKVLKPGMDTRQVVARFEAERQALALMDHPSIAHVFDGGQTASGRPYFVMELVKGPPITQYCDEHNLPIRERLKLFITVCQAVQHAHQKGIIHRDIKPSNLMVSQHDGAPVVKVIDFGIAKATGAHRAETTALTNVAQMIGTPMYMSPEQAALGGLDVDTRSDIYSLGVVLYELLTGTTPFAPARLQAVGQDEMLRIIREEEPPRPSERLKKDEGGRMKDESKATKRTVRHLRLPFSSFILHPSSFQELDWIVMKALDKNRNRRYESAAAFAADVGRYLRDEPVEACPPSRWYRLGKTLRRHRVAVLTATAFVTLLLVAVAVSAWLAVRADEAKTLAQARLGQIEQANAVLASVFQSLDPRSEEKGGPNLQDQLAGRLLEAARQLDGAAVGDAPTVARLQYTLGLTLDQLGHYREAIDLLTTAHTTRVALFGPLHRDTLATQSKLAEAIMHNGALDRAIPLLEQTLQRRKAQFGADDPDTLSSMHYLAQGYQLAGQRTRALGLMEETVARRKEILGADDVDTLVSINDLALAYKDDGQPKKAIPLHEVVLKQQQAKLAPSHPHTLTSMQNLALAYQAAGERGKAMPLYVEVLRLRQERLGPDHPQTLGTMLSLAEAYRIDSQLKKAIPLLEETVSRARIKLPPNHAVILTGMNNLAVAYENAGERATAIKLYEQTAELRKAAWGADHPGTLNTMTNLAVAYSQNDQIARSVELFEEILRLRKAKWPGAHPEMLRSLANLGAAYREAGRVAEGIPLLVEALDKARKISGGLPPTMVWMISALAVTYDADRQLTRAEPLYREFLQAMQQQFGPDHIRTANALGGLAANLLKQKQYVEAEEQARKCLDIRIRKLPDDWQTFSTRSLLGAALLGQKKHATAEPFLVEGCEGMQKRAATIPPPGRPRLREALERLVELYEATGETEKADAARLRLQAHRAAEAKVEKAKQ